MKLVVVFFSQLLKGNYKNNNNLPQRSQAQPFNSTEDLINNVTL